MCPKVSVVITTYNRSHDLLNALRSIDNQTYREIEIVVVDDASTDDTEQVCKAYTTDRDFKYVKIEKSEKKTGNYARNKGILAATGEYIALMDDDDTWKKDKIKKQIEYLTLNPEKKGVVCSYDEIFIVNGKEYSSLIDKYYYAIKNRQFENHNYAFPFAYVGITSALMLQRDALVTIGMFDDNLKAFQEVEMTYRFRKQFEIGAIKESFVNYYNHIGSKKQQVSNSIERTKGALRYIEQKYKEEFSAMDEESLAAWEITKNSCLFDRAARGGDKSLAWKYGIKALRLSKEPNECLKLLLKIFLVYVGGFEAFVKVKHLAYLRKSN